MGDTRVPDTINRLVQVWSAAVGTTVWNGAIVTGDFSDCLYVGYDGDPEGDFQAVDCDSEWAGLGAKARDEEFDVICAAFALDGGNDVSAARTRVYALLKVAADALRADPSLGFTPPYTAEVKGGELFTPLTDKGIEARVVFRVHVETRI